MVFESTTLQFNKEKINSNFGLKNFFLWILSNNNLKKVYIYKLSHKQY